MSTFVKEISSLKIQEFLSIKKQKSIILEVIQNNAFALS